MATRFAFSETATSDITPAISAAWTASGSSLVRCTQIIGGGRDLTTLTNMTLTIDFSSGTASTLFRRYVSWPLAAQTISGNIRGQFEVSVSGTTGATVITKLIATVVDGKGNIQATLFNGASGSSTLGTTLTNRFFPTSTAITSYTCNTGDRIVFEIGLVRTAGTTTRNGNIRFGFGNTTDLAVDETTTTTNLNPWVEISNNIIFNHGITF